MIFFIRHTQMKFGCLRIFHALLIPSSHVDRVPAPHRWHLSVGRDLGCLNTIDTCIVQHELGVSLARMIKERHGHMWIGVPEHTRVCFLGHAMRSMELEVRKFLRVLFPRIICFALNRLSWSVTPSSRVCLALHVCERFVWQGFL